MKLRGRTGEFDHAEDSGRSRQLTELWEEKWPGCEPVGYLLRSRHPERWVRFHSLPGSKRYADDPEEYRELLRRHRTLLTELMKGSDTSPLIVVAVDWGSQDLASGSSREQVPKAWPWRIVDDDFDPEAGRLYCWVQLGVDEGGLDALLLSTADDEGRFLIAGPDLDWLYCPYDGGVDVLLSSTAERDALRGRHAGWLPSLDDRP
jgi:hypothetical protein